jgi:hypothetical protein
MPRKTTTSAPPDFAWVTTPLKLVVPRSKGSFRRSSLCAVIVASRPVTASWPKSSF